MSRSNIVLGAIFLVVVGIWYVRGGDDEQLTSGPAPRLFPEFNREAAAGIRIDGGWKGFPYEYRRTSSGWVLASAGGYPVRSDEIDKFVEAVASLRRDNLVGESSDLKAASRTGDLGRKVTIIRESGAPMAEFYIGKHPKGEWQSYFIRRADEDRIYRTKTVTDKATDAEPSPFPGMSSGAPGFDWAQYANNTHKFVKTDIWNLDDGEVREVWLERPGDGFTAKLVREEDEQWSLVEGEAKAKADTAAVEDITGSLSYLAFEEVVGAFDDEEARAKYGLDKPAITLVLTMRRKVEEKKDEAAEEKEEGAEKEEEGAEDEGGEEKEPAKPKYETFTRTITVGNKVKLPRRYDDEKGEAEEQEFYAIKVSGDLKDPERANYIFLVDDYKVGPLKKSLEDLRQKEKKEDKGDEDSGSTDGTEEGGEKKTDEPKKDEPGTDEPKTDEPKVDEPKKEDPKTDEPKTDEPKTDEPKTDEPKTDDPKTDEPKKDDPQSDEPTTDDPKTDDPKSDG